MRNNLLNIKTIRQYVFMRKIYWTEHCLSRLDKRNISISNVKYAIKNGKIIEYYYDDYPYPSCLIYGYDCNKNVLHIVCGMSEKCIYMITAYYPDLNMWEEDMKIRRK